jgi:hypothetical protein
MLHTIIFRRDLFDEDIFARPEEEQPETDDHLEKLDGIDPAAQGNLSKGVDNKTVLYICSLLSNTLMVQICSFLYSIFSTNYI